MRILRFRDPNTYTPPPLKKAKVSPKAPYSPQPDLDLTCHETMAEVPVLTGLDVEYLHNLHENRPFAPECLSTRLQTYPEVTAQSRAILVDRMIVVSTDLALKRETLYMAVSLLDQFVCTSSVTSMLEFQLAGLASLFVCCKYEETVAPRLEAIVWSSGLLFTPEELTAMERRLLAACEWHLPSLTPQHWVQWGMRQWDSFPPLVRRQPKHTDMHRQVTQVMDAMLLDDRHYRVSGRDLVFGCFYLSFGKWAKDDELKRLFWMFAERAFGVTDESGVADTLSFVQRYAGIHIETAPQADLTYQTHNPHSLFFYTHTSSLV